jgi:hypothetical protein
MRPAHDANQSEVLLPMSQGRDPEQAVRALLLAASDDLPPTDLLRAVRRRSRHRRALVPSLATAGALGVAAVVALTATTVTGTQPAQARALVAAAVSRTASDGYRVRVTSSKTPDPTVGITVGVFDPASRSGRMVAVRPDKGHVTIFIGRNVYVQIPADQVSQQPGIPKRARWLLRTAGYPPDAGIPKLAEFNRVALQNPQQALDWVRSAGDVRKLGRAAGQGWTGVRYAFTLTDRRWQVAGTVDVDRDGRVRRLELTSRATDRPWAVANGLAATVHAVLEFWDFGAHERVTVPPADQVYRLPTPEELKERLSERRSRASSARPGRG